MVVKLWMKAAKLGHVGAQYKMEWCYENGIGFSQEMDKAVYWYRKAAEHGSERAKTALRKLLSEQ